MTSSTDGTVDRRRPVVPGLTTADGFASGDLTSPARAAEVHALVDATSGKARVPVEATSTSSVTELRIHGVSGSNGPTMLEHPVSVQVAGDAVAGFHRRWTPAAAGGASVRGKLEAYSWGGLTEARLASASWILLAPFMLYNVAHYMLPTRDGREGRHARADGVLRLLALTATLQMVIATIGALLDIVALQVGSAHRAFTRPSWLDDVPGTAALVGVLVVIGLLWWVGVQTANSYEARIPAAGRMPQPPTGDRPQPAVELRWPLAEPAFWRGKELVDRQRALHTAAALAAVALVGALPGWNHAAHGICLVSAGIVLVIVVVVTGTSEVARYDVAHQEVGEGTASTRGPVSTREHRIATLVIAAITAVGTIGVGLYDGTWAGRPDLTAQLTVVWSVLTTVQVIGLVVFGALVWSLRPVRGSTPAATQGAAPLGPYLRGHLSTAVVTLAVLLGGLLSAVVSVAAARPFGSPVPTGPTLAAIGAVAGQVTGAAPPVVVIAIPWPLYAFAAAVVGFALAGLITAVGLGVWFSGRRATLEDAVETTYEAAPTTDGFGPDRRRVARAWAVGDLADVAGPVVAVITAGGVLAVALAALLLGTSVLDAPLMRLLIAVHLPVRVSGAEGASLVGTSASVLTLIALGISGWLVTLLRRAYGDSAERRTIGAVWDVGTFWPRATHPLAPPCYAERAVPEVVDRISALTGHDPAEPGDVRVGPGSTTSPDAPTLPFGPVLLTGYSQGSIIAPAAVAQLRDDVRDQVALLTLACPARRLYGRAFPAFFGRDHLARLDELLTTTGGRRLWTNAVRRSDYIGSWVGRPPDTPESTVLLGKVDAWCDDPVALVRTGRPTAPIHRHSSWWPDPQVGRLAERLKTLLAPTEDPAQNGRVPAHTASADPDAAAANR